MNKTTFTLLLSLSCCWLGAQCPTGDVTFSTQGQIDSFQIYYPGCTDMPGSITISGSDITRLDSLYPLKKIGGPLRIENTHLANLNGLNQLDAVQSEFTIRYNPNLTTLSGLENLRFVGKRFFSTGFSHAEYGFVIAYNPGLKTLSGLDNFMSTTGCLSLIANDSLVSLEGLGQLTFIAGCYGGDDAGNDWAKGLEVYENPLLVSLNGLGQMDTFVALSIEANPLFSSLHDLSNLRVVEHNLSLSGNPSLKSLGGLDSLRYVGGSLYIGGNDSLSHLGGLEKLDSLGGELAVTGNPMLTSLDGLARLQKIGYRHIGFFGYRGLFLYDNTELISINQLSEVRFDSNSILSIRLCSKLAICAVKSICRHFQNGGLAAISDNAPGCNTSAEVEAACIVSIEDTSGGEPVIVFSPNPAGDFLQIQIEGSEKWDISLFDLQGRQMYRQRISGSQRIEVINWPSGIYALRAISGGRAYAGKFIKQ